MSSPEAATDPGGAAPTGPGWPDFAEREGTVYRLAIEALELELVLEEAAPLPQSARAGGGFRLVFRGPADPILPQAIYPLASDSGSHDIFLVPIARDTRGVAYEAIFN